MLVAFVLAVGVAAAAPTPAPLPAPWEGAAFAAPAAEIRRAVDALPVPTGTPSYEVLLEESVVQYDAGQRETFSRRRVVLVRSENAMRTLSRVWAPYAPWHQQKPKVRARVISPAGTEATLDQTTLTESPVYSSHEIYTDERAVVGPYPPVQVGSVIEEEITWVDTAPLFSAGVARETTLAAWIPTQRIRVRVEAPAAVPLQLAVRDSAAKVSRTAKNGVVTWSVDTVPPVLEWQYDAPNERPRATWSTGASWQGIAAAYSKQIEARLDAGKVELPDGLAGLRRSERIDRLLAYVHDRARYTGVEFGEAAIVPASPADVLARGFGDCKDKATLLVSLLRAADVPADVVLVSAGSYDYVEEALPGLAFNHAIVRIAAQPGGDPEVWIDATSTYSRAGELPLGDRGRLALVVSPDTRGLVRTPVLAPESRIRIEREVTFAKFGAARVVETARYDGTRALELRSQLADSGVARTREYFDATAKRTYTASRVQVDVSDLRDLSAPVLVRTTADGTQRATTSLTEAALYGDIYTLFSTMPGSVLYSQKERTAPWTPDEPSSVQVDYVLVPPDGYTMDALPPDVMRTFGTASYSFVATREGDRVRLRWFFRTGNGPLSPADVEELRKFQRDRRAELFSFDQRGERLLNAGRVADALQEFRALAARHPDDPLPLARTARALIAGGLGAAARTQAAAAAKLAPKDPLVQSMLADVLMHDLLGRWGQPGIDRPGAEAAYRTAIALEPEEVAHHRGLGVVLGLDDDGHRTNDPVKLRAALVPLRKAYEIAPDAGYYDALYFETLFRAGELTELRDKAATSTRDQETAAPFVIASVAMASGVDAALGEAHRLRSSREDALSRSTALLIETRRYDLATGIIDNLAITSTGDRRLDLQARARLLGTIKPFAAEKPATPEAFVTLTMIRILRGEMNDKELIQLVPKRMLTDEEWKEAEGFEAGIVQGVANSSALANFPRGVIGDLIASLAEVRAEGDELGWKVTARFPGPSGNSDIPTLFVVKEKGELKLIPMKADYAFRESAHLARSGKLEAARRWMDWALELVDSPGSDPSEGQPAAHFWPGSRKTEDDVTLTAALHARDADSVPVLKRAFKKAQGRDRIVIGRAYVDALVKAERFDDALAAVARLGETPAGDKAAVRARVLVLRKQKRLDEALKVAERAHDAARSESWTLDLVMDVLRDQGNLQRRVEIRRSRASSGGLSASALNGLAWEILVLDGSADEAAKWAEKSCTAYGNKSSAALHTLATAYAETGRPVQARDALIASLSAAGRTELRPEDWYVVGRIAEIYGLADVARDAYDRAKAGTDEDVRTLVARRLQGLR